MSHDLNESFRRYRGSLETGQGVSESLGQLLLQAQRYAYPLRRTFPGSDRAGGDQYDDAVQDAVLRLAERAREIDPDRFNALLSSSVRHALIDKSRRLRRQKDASFSALGVEAEMFGGERHAAHDVDALKSRILRAASRCAPEAIEAWCDQKDGMTHEQIARRDGVPLGTVKSRINAVHAALRGTPGLEKSLADYGPGELTGLESVVDEMRRMAAGKRQPVLSR